MEERRSYPRVQRDWTLYLGSESHKKKIGYINNLSASGFSVTLATLNKNELNLNFYDVMISIQSGAEKPVIFNLKAEKKWQKKEADTLQFGISIDPLESAHKSEYIRCISRTKDIKVEAIMNSGKD